jgi:hypothetical protein
VSAMPATRMRGCLHVAFAWSWLNGAADWFG